MVRQVLRLGVLSIAVSGFVACAPAAAPSPPPAVPIAPQLAPAPAPPAAPTIPDASPARTAQLYEAAKKEGKVVMYTTGTTKEAEDYKKPFEAKYPGVEVEYFTGVSEDIVNRLTAEARAGKTLADMVVMTLGGGWVTLLKEGYMADYLSPELKNYGAQDYHPQGLYTNENYSVYIIAYNPKLVSDAEAPKSYADLLKPQFKGKVVVEAEPYEWFVNMQKWMGKEKAIDYFKQLTPQAQMRKGHTAVAEVVSAGEFAVSPTVYQHRAQEMLEKGAPIKWVAPDPTFGFPRPAGILKNAPHANAARLFLDWRLSDEGQQIVVKQARIPTRNGVFPNPRNLKEGINFFPIDPTVYEEIDAAGKVFRDIFGTF